MAKYILAETGINWLAIMALLTFFAVFTLALIMVIRKGRDSYTAIAQQPLQDSYSTTTKNYLP